MTFIAGEGGHHTMTKAAKVLRVSLTRATNNQCIGQVQCKAFEQFTKLKTRIHGLNKKRHAETRECKVLVCY